MSIMQQRQRQQQRRRGMYFLLLIGSFAELLSLIPSTDGFATSFSWHEKKILSKQHQTKRTRTTSRQTRLLDAVNDPHHNRHCNNEPPSSYVLKERNPYDVHVYYNGQDERKAAMELRQKMQNKFGDWMRFYNPKDQPIGPHPLPMWEADFGAYENRHKLTEVRDFVLQHNNNNSETKATKPLSILIHPHSLDGDYADHTKHAFWAGEVLELRIQGWKR